MQICSLKFPTSSISLDWSYNKVVNKRLNQAAPLPRDWKLEWAYQYNPSRGQQKEQTAKDRQQLQKPTQDN